MNNGFTKGMIIGGMVGAAVSMMTHSDGRRNRKKMMRNGKRLLMNSGSVIGDVIQMFK